MELFMNTKLYKGLNRVQRLPGTLEFIKKVGYSLTMAEKRIEMMAGVQKPKIHWAISLFLVLYFFVLTAQAQYGGGTGEPNDPYLIYTAEQMNAIGTEPNDWDKHFKLMADIDLSGFNYYSALIAPDTDPAKLQFQGTPFSGDFDGNGHAISHLTIAGSGYLGLFGQLESGAEIKDLGVVDVNITGSGDYVGGLMGRSCGIITDCYTSGSVSGRLYVGGLVGDNFLGQVLNCCYSAGSARGENHVGGLLGCNYVGNVLNCYSTGSARGEYYVGGLVGCNYGNVLNCYSTGSASGENDVGGLVGRNGYRYLAGYVCNVLNCCYSTATVSGNVDVGGLVGVNSNGQVLNCYSTGSARGDHGVGGLVGWNNHGEVTSALLLIIRGVVIPHLMRNPGRSISLDSHFRGNDNHQFSCNRALAAIALAPSMVVTFSVDSWEREILVVSTIVSGMWRPPAL